MISRYWTLTATDITSDVTFNYLDPTDIPGTVTEANLHVLKHETGNPADFSDQGGTVSTAANNITATGVSSFSNWTLGEAASNLAITITDGVTGVTPGGSVTYTTMASNNGTASNPAATVQANFPASLTCSTTCTGALGGTCSAGPFAGNINDADNIPSGGSVTHTSVCSVSPAATGSLSTTATVSAGALSDPDTSDNSANDTDGIAASADLSITKTDGVTTATPGGSVTYVITASNAGPSNATGATVADTFPASETCTWTCSGVSGGTCTASGSGNINDTVNLPSAGSVNYTATCSISAAATGTLSNTATVTAPAGMTDPTPGNNSATDSDTLLASTTSLLGATKTVSASGGFVPGATIVYTVVVNNTGLGAQTDNPGDEFTDFLPTGITLVSATATSGTTTTGAGIVHWNSSIPAAGSVTITITATINANANGTIVNQGSVQFDADGNGTNESTALTNDPSIGGGTANPTSFAVVRVAAIAVPVPTLDWLALLGLAMLLGLGAVARQCWSR